MSSFIAANALTPIYDSVASAVIFRLALDVAGTIDAAKTASVTFFIQDGDDVIEKEFFYTELLTLISSNDSSLVYSFPVSVTGKLLLVWGVETNSVGDDTTIPINGDGNIPIVSKPDSPIVELLTKVISVATDVQANVSFAGTIVKIYLSATDGGAPLQNLNVLITTRCTGVASTKNLVEVLIVQDNIDAGFIEYTLPSFVHSLPEGTKLAIFASVDNGSQQSKLSHPLILVATLKPSMPSLEEVLSGMLDGDAPYFPLKMKVDSILNDWTKLNILVKDSDGDWILGKELTRTDDMETEMATNGFIRYDFAISLSPFTKYELALCTSTVTFNADGSSSQSKISPSKKGVTGAAKLNLVSDGLFSAYTAAASGVAAKQIFSHSCTFDAQQFDMYLSVNLHQKGVQIDTKQVVITAGAVDNTVSFDRLASLVDPSDKFKVIVIVNYRLPSESIGYLNSDGVLSGRPTLKLFTLESKEVVPEPLPADLKTVINFIAVDDIKTSGGLRNLLVELQTENDNAVNHPFVRCEIEVATDSAFSAKLPLTAAGATSKSLSLVGDSIDGLNIISAYYLVAAVGTAATANYVAATGTFGQPGYIPEQGTAASADYVAAHYDQTNIASNTDHYIHVRIVKSWLGAGAGDEVIQDWVVYNYITQEVDSIPAPVTCTIAQKKINFVEVTFDKADEQVTWTGDELIGTKQIFKPVLYMFTLFDETNRVMQTKNIPFDKLSKASMKYSFDLDDHKLDQFVRVTHVISYKNEDNKIILSDMIASNDLFLDKPLVIKSIKAVETLTIVKVEVEVDFGRTDETDIEVKLIIPFVESGAEKYITSALTRNALTKLYESGPLTKQADPQRTKYGESLVIYAIATGPFGTIVRRLPL